MAEPRRVLRLGEAALRTYRRRGARGVTRRAAQLALERVAGQEARERLLLEDITHSSLLDPPAAVQPEVGRRPLRIGWVSTPPAAGSGGHTTMFRMVSALEAAGHECRLFLYDVFGGDVRRHEAVVRASWPDVRCAVVDARTGIHGVDVAIATSWESAHVLASRGTTPRRAYFIQDYEPYFHGRGWEYALAEDSYRFGFRLIALGQMVSDTLRRELGVESDVVEFGLDTEVYRLTEPRPRSGVVFFARPGFERRGYELGRMALQAFHREYPDQPIHVFGTPGLDLGFPVVDHGRLTPRDLNELYNSSLAGLALSFTNVSLVPEEMLAAGVIPVCNESELARACLVNPHVRWAPPTPLALAQELGTAVMQAGDAELALQVAGSVQGRGWTRTGVEFVSLLEEWMFGQRDEVGNISPTRRRGHVEQLQ